MATRTAAVMIIGDEILSGQTRDLNSGFLSRQLRDLGVELGYIAVIPDDVPRIASTLAYLAERFDHVFTSGGIGPTHDDVTIEGVARAFGVKVVRDSSIEDIIRERFQASSRDAAMKMAEVPEGSELIHVEGLKLPLIAFRNIFIFPGIPEYLEKEFQAIKERLREDPYHLRKVFIDDYESNIAQLLQETEEMFPGVKIGSYPQMKNGREKVKVTIQSKDENTADDTLDHIVSSLEPTKVVRVE